MASRHANAPLAYPAHLEPVEEGGFVVTFPDFGVGITQGDDRAEALAQAADLLETMVANYMAEGWDLPEPSPAQGRPLVWLAPMVAARARALSGDAPGRDRQGGAGAPPRRRAAGGGPAVQHPRQILVGARPDRGRARGARPQIGRDGRGDVTAQPPAIARRRGLKLSRAQGLELIGRVARSASSPAPSRSISACEFGQLDQIAAPNPELARQLAQPAL
jgi:predicted RNase H-like HicB family nuclease